MTCGQWNGPTVAQKSFEADYAFGPQTSNDHVYEKTVIQSDVRSLNTCLFIPILVFSRWSR